jgi:hypothetical protein
VNSRTHTPCEILDAYLIPALSVHHHFVDGINIVADMCGIHLDAGTMRFAPQVLAKLDMAPAANWADIEDDPTAAQELFTRPKSRL